MIAEHVCNGIYKCEGDEIKNDNTILLFDSYTATYFRVSKAEILEKAKDLRDYLEVY